MLRRPATHCKAAHTPKHDGAPMVDIVLPPLAPTRAQASVSPPHCVAAATPSALLVDAHENSFATLLIFSTSKPSADIKLAQTP